MKYTMGTTMEHHSEHLKIVQSDVTRNIGHCFADIYDEVQAVFNDVITFKEGEGLSLLTISGDTEASH